MSKLSIPSMFSFSRVKVVDSERMEPGFGSGALVEIEPDERYRPICSNCGSQASRNHSNHQRFLRDLSVGPYHTLVQLHYRKVVCPECGIRVEDLGVADPGGPRVTKRLAAYIYDLCKVMTIQDVADHLHLDWKTVKEIEKTGLKNTEKLITAIYATWPLMRSQGVSIIST